MDKISHYSLLSTVLKGVGRRRRLTNFSCSILIPWINILQNTKYSMPDWTLSQWTSQCTLMANPLSHRSHSLLWLPSQDLQHGSIENLAGSYRLILSRSNQSLTTHLGKCDWAQGGPLVLRLNCYLLLNLDALTKLSWRRDSSSENKYFRTRMNNSWQSLLNYLAGLFLKPL